jgi:hypothetical protein
MVYEETFLRNFRFYAKTLTKLHNLTVLARSNFQWLKGYCHGYVQNQSDFMQFLVSSTSSYTIKR